MFWNSCFSVLIVSRFFGICLRIFFYANTVLLGLESVFVQRRVDLWCSFKSRFLSKWRESIICCSVFTSVLWFFVTLCSTFSALSVFILL